MGNPKHEFTEDDLYFIRSEYGKTSIVNMGVFLGVSAQPVRRIIKELGLTKRYNLTERQKFFILDNYEEYGPVHLSKKMKVPMHVVRHFGGVIHGKKIKKKKFTRIYNKSIQMCVDGTVIHEKKILEIKPSPDYVMHMMALAKSKYVNKSVSIHIKEGRQIVKIIYQKTYNEI